MVKTAGHFTNQYGAGNRRPHGGGEERGHGDDDDVGTVAGKHQLGCRQKPGAYASHQRPQDQHGQEEAARDPGSVADQREDKFADQQGNLKSLSLLDCCNIVACFEQAVVGSGVEPGHTTTKSCYL